MPRLPRIYIKNAVYFISCRAEQNENIFKDDEDYKMFLELMKKYQEQYGIKIFAYVLMVDHLHLLVEMEKAVGEEENKAQKCQEISDFMHDLNNNYTKYYNGRYNRKGHLFRERFKSAIIEKSEYLLKMTAYIHLNPQRLNLVKDAKEYPHSSYQLYLYNDLAEKKDLKQFTNGINEVLALLNDKNYADYVNSLSKDEGEYIHKKIQRGGILGSDQFAELIKSEVAAYQQQGDADVLEIRGKKSYRLFVTFGSLLLVLIISAAGVYFLSFNRRLEKIKAQPAVKAEDKFDQLKLSEWDIQLNPVSGGNQSADRLTFLDGKFVSANLNSLGFPGSNYSVSVDANGKIIWETMQTSADGTASWRGEIEQGRMTGILSLRQTGKEPQDFSFVSIQYKRKGI